MHPVKVVLVWAAIIEMFGTPTSDVDAQGKLQQAWAHELITGPELTMLSETRLYRSCWRDLVLSDVIVEKARELAR